MSCTARQAGEAEDAMHRFQRVAVLAALLVVVAGTPTLAQTAVVPAPAPAPSAAPTGYLPVASWQLLAEVNKHRRARGLVALKVDPRLAATARAWSERMAARNVLGHNDALFTTLGRQRIGMRLLGENVGWNRTVLAQHQAFMVSSGHRRNIDYAAFRVAGFAVVRDSRGRLWSTEVFGTPRA
jgi:uncharacterized protein YkwD